MFSRLNKLVAIRGVLSTPHHPESNGVVERANGTLVNILRKLADNKTSEWGLFLHAAIFAYNISFHTGTRHSPFHLMYGRHPAIPPVLFSAMGNPSTLTYNDYLEKLSDTLIKLQAEALTEIITNRRAGKEADDKKRKPLEEFKVGSMVFYHDVHTPKRKAKLDSLWEGPFEIIEKTGQDAYTIKSTNEGQILNRVHGRFLKSYKDMESMLPKETANVSKLS